MNIDKDIWKDVFYSNISAYIEVLNSQLIRLYSSNPLNKYIELIGGYAFKSREYKKSGIPIIRISDFQNEKIVLKNVVYYKQENRLEKYLLERDDIIIALTGGTIGKLAIVQDGLGKIYLNQRVAKFNIIDKKSFEKEYIYWIARGVQEKIKKLAWGGAQPNVSPSQIEEMEFPIPPIDIQKKIIEFINNLKDYNIQDKHFFNKDIEQSIIKLQSICYNVNSLTTETKLQSTYLSKLRQSILQEAIEGKLTEDWREKNRKSITKGNPNTDAVALLEKIKSEKEKMIAEGKLRKDKPLPAIKKEEIPFVLPEGWVWCRLGEVVESMTNGIYKPDFYYNDNGIACIRMYNIKDGKINYDNLKRMNLSNEEIQRYKLILNDLVVNRVNSVELLGKAGLIRENKEPLIFESKNIRVRFFYPKIISPYINFIFLSKIIHLQILKNFKKVTGQASVNQVQIANYHLPLPPLAEQYAIVEKIESLMKSVDELETQVQERKRYAEDLLQSVLREAFEG